MLPAADDDAVVRRSVVPPRAARSLWLAAVWTGVGTAALGAIVAVVAVAVCWLPASGSSGSANSTLRAGLLTFLAGLHGGITIDSVAADFVPLGLTVLLALLAWRAGTGLADAAADLDENEPGRLVGAALVQAGAFALTCAAAGRFATLGTSSVPAFGVTVAAFVLFLASGGVSFVCHGTLSHDLASAAPPWIARAGRAAVAVVAVYLAGGALLAAASLAMHHHQVQALSAQVGGGWSGVPILLLGVLAAPNAVIAGSSYLAGPGFAVGSGNTVTLTSGGHGLVPAFPILGGVPSHPAGPWAWVLAAVTFTVAAGCAAALITGSAAGWATRFADVARAAAIAAVLGGVLAWQGGGAIGSGHLAAVGASPWQLGAAFAGLTLVGGATALALVALAGTFRGRTRASGRLHLLAERATAAADVATARLDAARTVVKVDGDEADRGFLRATLSSVAKAVTTTEDERAAG